MQKIAVALIEPQYHVNAGHVARLIKNFGLSQLYLVNPRFDRGEAVRYSTHGKDVLASAKTMTLAGIRKKFDVLIGTTAIRATSRLNVLRVPASPAQMARIVSDSAGSKKSFCIVLGRESSGLSNRELELCDLVVVIDTGTRYRTLNIAHALAILLYEIARCRQELVAAEKNYYGAVNGIDGKSESKKNKRIDLASKRDVDLLLQYVSRAADAGGYDAHKKPLLQSSVKKMVAKSTPTSKDVMLLVSLLRKSVLAVEREKAQKAAARTAAAPSPIPGRKKR